MKILFVGSTRGTDCSLHYFTAFNRLQHTVIPFDPEYFQTRSLIENFRLRLTKGPDAAKRQRVSDQIVQICRKNHFDLVFVMAETFLGWETLAEVRKTSPSPPLFAFHSHDNVFADGILKPRDFSKTLAAYDLLFTTKSQNVARYRELGSEDAFYLPSAYEPSVHRPISRGESRIQNEFSVSFIGTYDRSRHAPLEATGWHRLHVWGNGWNRYPGFAEHRDRIRPNAVYYFEFADILSHSRISLGLLREEAQDLHTQRTFEIPACAAMQIAPRNPEILSFFKEDREIVCFGSTEELRDKVDFYLRNDEARHRIARCGWERCVQGKNTYLDRVELVVSMVEKKRRPVSYTGALG